MLFNSYGFIFAFLPCVFLIYFILNRLRWIPAAKVWLVLASLFFYSWWNVRYLPLILASLAVNYIVGVYLGRLDPERKRSPRKVLLVGGLIFNVGLLGYYKYADFFIDNVNAVFQLNLPLLQLVLPLAISFFTFQQIAYLVDAYRKEVQDLNFLNYSLFVTFFPQLIAGPIVHHKEMMPQFARLRSKLVQYRNITTGLFIFTIGLFKKVAIADTFAVWATKGYSQTGILTTAEAWVTSLSYTFQLYFDFSGYTDMAIGAALLFNIKLPINFNSPYKALSIQEFWGRWHMTLSRFLREYIYFPMGGSRKGPALTYLFLLLVFLISGLWHGAGWTFVFWGFLHGAASVIHRAWRQLGFKLPQLLAWFLTFQFVNASWVFFRAESWGDAINVLQAMIGLSGTTGFRAPGVGLGSLLEPLILIAAGLILTLAFRNSMEMRERFRPKVWTVIFAAVLFLYSVYHLNKISEFLYFNF